MIECSNCGENNRPGAIYCRACGGRLIDPMQLNKEEQKRLQISKSRLDKTSKGSVQQLFKIVIPVVLVVLAGYLILQPVFPGREPKLAERYVKKFEEKLLRLQDSYNNGKQYRIAVTEEELNSFLKLNVTPGKSDSFDLLLDEGLLIYLYRSILGKPITLTIYCGVLVEHNQFRLDVLRVQFGKLPIPSFFVGYLINSVFLKKFSDEISTPPYITGFEFSENLMYIKYDPYASLEDNTDTESVQQQVNQMLKQANTLYKNQEYKKALEAYKQIIKKYPKDPRIPTLQKWCEEIETKLLNQ